MPTIRRISRPACKSAPGWARSVIPASTAISKAGQVSVAGTGIIGATMGLALVLSPGMASLILPTASRAAEASASMARPKSARGCFIHRGWKCFAMARKASLSATATWRCRCCRARPPRMGSMSPRAIVGGRCFSTPGTSKAPLPSSRRTFTRKLRRLTRVPPGRCWTRAGPGRTRTSRMSHTVFPGESTTVPRDPSCAWPPCFPPSIMGRMAASR